MQIDISLIPTLRTLVLLAPLLGILHACKQVGQKDQESEIQATNVDSSKAIGPILDPMIANKTLEPTRSLINEYSAAVRAFKSAYGEAEDPYQVVMLRSTRFISRVSWDKGKITTNFNPITATDKYNFEHERGTCRLNDLQGRPTNVWIAFERAAKYANIVMNAARSGAAIPFSDSYKNFPHVRNYFDSVGQGMVGSSPNFNIDIIHSIHAANGEGATQNESGCGKIAQFKVCDAMKFSPFFHPDPRPLPCRSASGWTPNASEWEAMLGYEMRQLGQFVVPIPNKAVAGSFAPTEYGGETCASESLKKRENDAQYSQAAAAQGWSSLKQKLPDFTEKALRSGAAYLDQEGKAGRIGAFAMYASVEQVYKDIANYRLKPQFLSTSAECSACGQKKQSDGSYLWDETRRGYCPQQCFTVRPFPERSTPKAKSIDALRPYFEPDSSDPNYRSIVALLNQHFNELRQSNFLANDPIRLAAQLQQWFVAMHPYIDGDGRTSRYLMEIVLNSVGLPFPVLNDFWADTQSTKASYEGLVREGISRHTKGLNACAAFMKCAKASLPSLTPQRLCSEQNSPNVKACLPQLSFYYGTGKVDTIAPCDCNTQWNKDPDQSKYAQCP